MQVFPGLVPGLFQSGVRQAATLPYGVTSETIITSDNEVLETWYYPAKLDAETENEEESEKQASKKPEVDVSHTPLAIIFHGNAESVESTFQLQSWLSKLGISSLSYDYRGFGLSTGWPSDAGLKRDVIAVIKHASKKYDLKQRKVILLGQSIGTGLASYATKFIPDASLVLLSPYTSLEQVVSEMPLIGYLKQFLFPPERPF